MLSWSNTSPVEDLPIIDRGEAHDCGTILLGSDSAGVAASNDLHRSEGLWAFDSLNGNCWTSAAEFLKSSKADGAMMQESKLRGLPKNGAEQAARNSGWNASISECIVTHHVALLTRRCVPSYFGCSYTGFCAAVLMLS